MKCTTAIREVDSVEITTLVDNVVDLLLENSDNAKRAPRIRDGALAPPLLAEHGFSAIIRVSDGAAKHSILLDAGLTETTMLVNADRLGIDFSEIEAVVISHGHVDHVKALMPALNKLRRGIPIVIHPHAFSPRILRIPDGTEVRMEPLDPVAIERAGATIFRRKGPSTLAEDMVLVTGEIPRVTEFEFGFPIQYAVVDGVEQHDPLTPDDQALIVAVRGKGLVVISGCAHSGIVNTLRYARELTGIEKAHAVVGGFHLSGFMYETIIEPTVAALAEISPNFLAPTHCTGWKAIHEFAKRAPEAFIQNSVGTTLLFGS
ncbi:MBL fold metallo-hydrolase [Candidatus Poribacteria bacterium]|nr:MBL fold metallo-hydrolase [Candidatus Poribacteria bacterium]